MKPSKLIISAFGPYAGRVPEIDFTKFEEKMGYARLMKIVHTYRNSQEVIDIAGNFIQKNNFCPAKGAEWICVGRKEAKGKKEGGESHEKTNFCGVCLPVHVDGVGAVHGVCRRYGFRRWAV